MGFPQFANIDKRIYDTMLFRAGNNKHMSEIQPWIRVTSTLHEFLTLESIKNVESFSERYGDTQKSGRVGTNKNGQSIYASNERAFRPSPTISSLNVSQGNEGLSKKVNFTITAYTKGQAEYIIDYFMEPGTHCLVEFGFNQSKSVAQKCNFSGDLAFSSNDIVGKNKNQKTSADKTATCEVVRYKNIAYVQNKRRASEGTYDAMLAIITGGNTNFSDNESYNIEVECTSIGELPAYLQHHKNIQTTDGGNPNESSLRFNPEEFSNYGDDNKGSAEEIGKSLFKQMFNDLPAHKRMQKVYNLVNESWAYNPSNFVNMDMAIRTELTENVKSGALALTSGENKKQLAEEISSNDMTEKAMAKNKDEQQPAAGSGLDVDSDGLRGGGSGGSNVKGKIPSDQPLFSDRRYIKVALAFTILEMQPNTSSQIPIICQDGQTVSPLYINWQDTICKGFKHMYSIDPNTLYIPNKHHPRFRIEGAFIDPVEEIKDGKTEIKAFTNPIPNLIVPDEKGNAVISEGQDAIIDMHPNPHGATKYSYFPSDKELVFGGQNDSDESYQPIKADPFNWGYLRNLYIDFDFFCQTIQQTSYLSKDVFYTLLNGLSGGVNMMWDFQIVEQCSVDYALSVGRTENTSDEFYQWFAKHIRGQKDGSGPMPGQEELAIVDRNFFGKKPPKEELGICGFQSRGLKSPFLSATLKFDIPSAMKGQLIAQRKKGGNIENPNLEQKEKNFKSGGGNKRALFSSYTDSVTEMIYHFNNLEQGGAGAEYNKKQQDQEEFRAKEDKMYEDAVEKAEAPWYKRKYNWIKKKGSDLVDASKSVLGFDSEEVKEVRNANYEMILNNANVIPYTQDREANLDLIQGTFDLYRGDNATLYEVARVSAWKDTEILKIITNVDESASAEKHSIILPIEFEFETVGISGFKLGDTFTIYDLPKEEYRTRYFQVLEVTHQIEQSIWKTKIRGAMRNEKSGWTDGSNMIKYKNKI